VENNSVERLKERDRPHCEFMMRRAGS